MRYRPVKVVNCFSLILPNEMKGRRIRTMDVILGKFPQTKGYWKATSKSLGDCGHHHKSAEAAQPCADRMKKEFTKRRSEASKAAATRRKETMAVANA